MLESVRERSSTDTRRPKKYLYPIILEKNEEQLREVVQIVWKYADLISDFIV